MARVYVSSTYADLEAHRSAVYVALRALRHDVIAMEDYVATDERPLARCLRDVAECDLYVGLLAWRYGFIPYTANAEDRSITEHEYRQAGRSGIPRLMFLADNDAPWPPSLMDATTGEGSRGRRIDEFRRQVSVDSVVSFFNSPETLARLVSVAVQRELGRQSGGMARMFVDHMRRSAGARTAQQSSDRYVPLRLQSSRTSSGPLARAQTGSWADVFTHPRAALLIGEPGSGKTTLALHEAAEMEQARDDRAPEPLYVSLAGFRGGAAERIFDLLAGDDAPSPPELTALWTSGQRELCLFVDEADQGVDTTKTGQALGSLLLTKATAHSLVVACRPGPLCDALMAMATLDRLVLLPLSDADIELFLRAYGSGELFDALDWRLREVLQEPRMVSALAQAWQHGGGDGAWSVGNVMQMYVGHLLRHLRSTYDVERVTLPVVGRLAYDLLRSQQNHLVADDELYDAVGGHLQGIYERYRRRRSVMPAEWAADDLLGELVDASVLDKLDAQGSRVPGYRISKPSIQAYLAAVELIGAPAVPAEILPLVQSAERDPLLETLVMAAGLAPAASAAALLDAVAREDLELATQAWVEARSGGRLTPAALQQALDRRIEDLAVEPEPASSSRDGTPRSAFDNGADPRVRFAAVVREIRDGVPSLAWLLDRATDEHPLVAGLADYALVHEGLQRWEGRWLPPPPLDISPNRAIAYHGVGGGEATVGPLQLLSIPIPTEVELRVDIGRVWFDPFEVDSTFRYQPMSPALVAAHFSERGDYFDWVGFLALCHQIALRARSAVAGAVKRDLQDLASRLRTRANTHGALALVLAEDLGLRCPEVENETGADDMDAAHDVYVRMRRLYGRPARTRLRQMRELVQDALDVEATVSARSVEGSVVTIRAGSVDLSGSENDPSGTAPIRIAGKQAIQSVAGGGSATALTIDELHGADHDIPLHLVVALDLAVNGSEGTVCGVHVGRLVGHPGWKVDYSVAVGAMTRGTLAGVVAELA
jgi:hypothetical protein